MVRDRELELAEIGALLESARAGAGRALVVRGEAGIGKTALLHEARRAAGDAFTVLSALGVESEAELAYAGLHQLLQPLLSGGLAALPAPQRSALEAAFGLSRDDPAGRMLVGLATLTLLSAAAGERPVLLLVDDIQWLDGESLDAIGFVIRRIADEAVGVLLAARDEGGRDVPLGEVPALGVRTVGDAEARALVRDAYGDALDDEAVERVVAEAAGNPLALLELGRGRTSDDARPPQSIEQAYVDRIRALEPATRALVLLAAADDRPTVDLIARAASSLGVTIDALEPAELAGLVAVHDGVVRFRHPLVRAAGYRGATFTERRRGHLALADALTGEEDADRRAWHRAAATVGADEEAATALERSAVRALARGGQRAASTALERAGELSPNVAERARRLVLAAEAAGLAGQRARALRLVDAADVPADDVSLAVDAARIRGVIEAQSGSPRDAMRIFLDAATAIRNTDRRYALELVALAQESAGLGGAVDEVVEFGRLTEGLGDGETPDERVMLGLVRGFMHLLSGDAAAAGPWLARAVTAGEESRDPRVLVWAGTAAMFAGREAAVLDLLGRAVHEARAQGAIGPLPFALHLLAGAERRVGNIAAAEADADESLRLARETGQDVVAAGALSTLTALAAFRGDAVRARALARETRSLAVPRGLVVQLAGLARAIAELELAHGRAQEAFAELDPILRERSARGATEPFALFSTPVYVEAAARAGTVDRIVLDQLVAFERWVESGGLAWGGALGARCRALLAPDEREADRLFVTANELHDAHPQPYEHARTQLLWGEHLRRSRRKSDARVPLRLALETFEGLGAAAWAQRAGAELRATGTTTRRRDDSTRGELTPQELQIVRLVFQGGTNPEIAAQLFLSPKTVQYHLRKVYAKLGIASRAELIRLVAAGSIPGAADVEKPA